MRRCRELKYWETDKAELDNWFANVARPVDLHKETGMSRSTINKYRKAILNENKSLQDLITIAQYRQLIVMHNSEHAQMVEEKRVKKEQVIKKCKQKEQNIQKMKKSLEKMGFDITPKKSQSKALSSEKMAEIKKKVENKSPKSEVKLMDFSDFQALSYSEMKEYIRLHRNLLTGKSAYKYLKAMQDKYHA